MAETLGPGTITVTGTGAAEAPPDLLTLTVGVECRRDGVAAAYADAGSAATAVWSVLRRHDVPETDVRTSMMQLRPDLVWRDGEGQRVAGYVASSAVTVRLRQVDRAAAIIAAVVEAGGDAVRLNGLDLGFSDAAAVAARARTAAWEDARRSAGQLAALASASLGQVLSVTDHSQQQGPVPFAGIQRAAAVDAHAVAPGESRVEAVLTVVWELRPAHLQA